MISAWALCANVASAEDFDTVFLRNGGRVRGTVMEEDPQRGVLIRLSNGTERQLPPRSVLRVQYAEAARGEPPVTPVPVEGAVTVNPPSPVARTAFVPMAPALPSVRLGVAHSEGAFWARNSPGAWTDFRFTLDALAGRVFFFRAEAALSAQWGPSASENRPGFWMVSPGVRALLGFRLGSTVALMFGGVIGFSFVVPRSTQCADDSYVGAYGGASAAMHFRFGARRQFEVGLDADALLLPTPECYMDFYSGGRYYQKYNDDDISVVGRLGFGYLFR